MENGARQYCGRALEIVSNCAIDSARIFAPPFERETRLAGLSLSHTIFVYARIV